MPRTTLKRNQPTLELSGDDLEATLRALRRAKKAARRDAPEAEPVAAEHAEAQVEADEAPQVEAPQAEAQVEAQPAAGQVPVEPAVEAAEPGEAMAAEGEAVVDGEAAAAGQVQSEAAVDGEGAAAGRAQSEAAMDVEGAAVEVERVLGAAHPFAVLALPVAPASAAAVAAAYRRLALAVHPDKTAHVRAADAFRMVAAAKAALLDPVQQSTLCTALQAAAAPAPAAPAPVAAPVAPAPVAPAPVAPAPVPAPPHADSDTDDDEAVPAVPEAVLRWVYEGEREAQRGEQAALRDARVHDDVLLARV